MHRIFGEIADPPDDVGMLPTVIDSLGARLRIARNEVKRRLKVSGRIRPRRSWPVHRCHRVTGSGTKPWNQA